MRAGEGEKLLAVEDPLDDSNDVARSSFAWRTVRQVGWGFWFGAQRSCRPGEREGGRHVTVRER
jgi:hypothetical protein